MNALPFRKNKILKSFIVIFSLLGLSTVYAQEQSGSSKGDGGLMKQMMPAKYQIKVITDPEAQARLRKVVIAETGGNNGGLMKQMTLAKYQPKVITDPEAQARLRKVVIAETGNNNGGLMKQMREQMMQANARYPDQVVK